MEIPLSHSPPVTNSKHITSSKKHMSKNNDIIVYINYICYIMCRKRVDNHEEEMLDTICCYGVAYDRMHTKRKQKN